MVLDDYERDPLVQSSLATSFNIVGRNNLLGPFEHPFGRCWTNMKGIRWFNLLFRRHLTLLEEPTCWMRLLTLLDGIG